MGVVQSQGQLALIDRPSPTFRLGGGLALYDGLHQSYATLYRTQPNVRTVIDFLARNIAQLRIKAYRRVSDTQRLHLPDHPVAQTLRRPAQGIGKRSRFAVFRDLVTDTGIFGESIVVKVRGPRGGLALIPWDPQQIDLRGENPLMVGKYALVGTRGEVELDPDQVIHVHYYHPEDRRRGLSPLETLRRTLAEEAASGEYREWYWRNAARREGVIERPADAPKWSDDARGRFRAEWQAKFAGARGSGMTPVLEDGMVWKDTAFSARDSQYLEARKLTREEVAAAFHIPPPMVGILDRATFSNIEEQHAMLYQDTLGPWLTFIAEEFEEQLLPEFDDVDDVYLEFNIEEKLRGRFDQRATSISAAVGRPWLTVDEARALDNRPPVPGGDGLTIPLNVLVGGQANPQDSVPIERGGTRALPAGEQAKARRLDLARRQRPFVDAHQEALIAAFERQRASVLSKFGANPTVTADNVFDVDRFDAELRDDLLALATQVAETFGAAAYDEVAPTDEKARGRKAFAPEPMIPWLRENTRIAASGINKTTLTVLAAASSLDEIGRVFDIAVTVRAAQAAISRVTTVSNFARAEGAAAGGASQKTWIVTSANPRQSHAVMDNETVAIGDAFSNGGKWPGDPALPVSEVAGCSCLVDFAT